MVNREKYHGLEYNLDKLINSNLNEIKDIELINTGEYLEKYAPAVHYEMKNNLLYSAWLDVNVCYIHILKDGHRNVGYVAYNVARDVKALSLSHVYLLEDFRGKGIFKNHFVELNNFRFSKSNFILQINQPNRFLINSLLKMRVLVPMNDYGLCLGVMCFFNINFGEVDDGVVLSAMTPFYDLNLFSPVGIIDGELIHDKVCDIDSFYFNALPIRDYHLNNENYVEGVKDWIIELQKALGDIAMKEVGDCSGLFNREGADFELIKKVMSYD